MKIGIIKAKLAYFIKRVYMYMYSINHPIKNNIILFSSFGGSQYSDNPRAISEKIHELYPEYHICWIVNRSNDLYNMIPDYVECIPPQGKRMYQAIITAHCYVYNMDLRPDTAKRKKQLFVQTWHGDRNFKKILYEAWENGTRRPFPVMDNKYTDIAIAGSFYCVEKYHSAFHYYGRIEMTGSPKNDTMLSSDLDIQLRIRKRLNIDSNSRILLYAPTFRDGNLNNFKVSLDLGRVLCLLQEKTGDPWICLIRAHPGAPKLEVSNKIDNLIDVTEYPDMADLLTITDYLITDYSNTVLDFYLTGKPSVCYIADKEEYVKNSRTLKNDPETVGAVCARTQEELENVIWSYTEEDYAKAYRKIDENYGTKESGDAARKIAQLIHAELEAHQKG